jgi:hypothetical protein
MTNTVDAIGLRGLDFLKTALPLEGNPVTLRLSLIEENEK